MIRAAFRAVVSWVVFLLASTVLGGLLAGIVDVVAPAVISGTVLGPSDPSSPLVWTVIGVVILGVSLRVIRS